MTERKIKTGTKSAKTLQHKGIKFEVMHVSKFKENICCRKRNNGKGLLLSMNIQPDVSRAQESNFAL